MRRSSLAVLVGACLWSAGAAAADAPPPPADDARAFERAAALREDGRYEESLALLEALHARTGAVELLNNIGWLLERLGRYREASAAYQRVVADPAAPPALVAKDQVRITALLPRLERAWLLGLNLPADRWIDGRGWPNQREPIGVAAGRRRIEVRRPGADDAVVRWIELDAGRTYDLAASLIIAPEQDAALELGDRPLDTLEVDGQRLQVGLRGLRRLWMRPGRYVVRARSGQATLEQAHVLEAGQVLRLRWPAVAPPTVTTSPPRAPEDASAAPWVLGAGAVGLGGAALGLRLAASADRAAVQGAALDGEGRVVGVTMRRAVELEGRADTRASVALGLAVGAGAAAVGAVLWALLD